MTGLGPELQTERLILRPPRLEDFGAWADFMADPLAAEFLGGPRPRSEAWRAIATVAGSWALMGYGFFSVIEKQTGQWVGRIGPWQPEGWPGPEIGWGLARHAWGKGYGAEAAIRAMAWVRDELGWQRVIHSIDPHNTRSIALAERVGSRRIGEALMPEPINMVLDLYGQELMQA